MPVVRRGHDDGVHFFAIQHPAEIPVNGNRLPLLLQRRGLTRQDLLVDVAQRDNPRSPHFPQGIDKLVSPAADASFGFGRADPHHRQAHSIIGAGEFGGCGCRQANTAQPKRQGARTRAFQKASSSHPGPSLNPRTVAAPADSASTVTSHLPVPQARGTSPNLTEPKQKSQMPLRGSGPRFKTLWHEIVMGQGQRSSAYECHPIPVYRHVAGVRP